MKLIITLLLALSLSGCYSSQVKKNNETKPSVQILNSDFKLNYATAKSVEKENISTNTNIHSDVVQKNNSYENNSVALTKPSSNEKTILNKTKKVEKVANNSVFPIVDTKDVFEEIDYDLSKKQSVDESLTKGIEPLKEIEVTNKMKENKKNTSKILFIFMLIGAFGLFILKKRKKG